MSRTSGYTVATCLTLLVGLGITGALMVSPGSSGPEDRLADTVPPQVGASTPPAYTPSEPAAPSDPTTATGLAPHPLEPEVVSWGGEGRQLAVVVRNHGDLAIRQARVLITALDSRQRTVLSTTGRPDSKCCTIVGLPPGGEFGLFVDTARDLSTVTEVVVRYLDLETEPGPGPAAGPITVADASLSRRPGDAVVTATLTTTGGTSPYVAGQAFLEDGDGRLVAVISGRFYCFVPGTGNTVRMHLTRAVPAGTRLRKVVVHPVPAGVPTLISRTCN